MAFTTVIFIRLLQFYLYQNKLHQNVIHYDVALQHFDKQRLLFFVPNSFARWFVDIKILTDKHN